MCMPLLTRAKPGSAETPFRSRVAGPAQNAQLHGHRLTSVADQGPEIGTEQPKIISPQLKICGSAMETIAGNL